MADDEEYDEVDAVVRICEGERLADLKKTDGWSLGFTPNTSDKRQEHGEIRRRTSPNSTRSRRSSTALDTWRIGAVRLRLDPVRDGVGDVGDRAPSLAGTAGGAA